MSVVALAEEPLSETAEDENVTDDQIEQLLAEAEVRLRARHALPRDGGDLQTQQGNDTAPRRSLPKLSHSLGRSFYIKEKDGIAQVDGAKMVETEQRRLADTPRRAESAANAKKTEAETDARQKEKESAGVEWYNLPKTEPTPQLKREFQMLEMRSVLDPHRHYKKDSRKGKLPAFSQVGTVVQGPTEWYSSRINKRNRTKNFVEEAITTEQNSGRFKRKYNEIQGSKTSGKKAHYKALMAKRKKRP